MKATQEPLKRTPVVLRLDADGSETPAVLTDRAGVASFDLPPTSGTVLVPGVARYEGRLDGEIPIALWLHQIFPRGGPQKQCNRLAGLLRTKGEH